MDKKIIGKKIVVGIIIFILTFSVLTTAMNSSLQYTGGNVAESNHTLFQGLFRLALEIILCYFLFRKHTWAKWIIVVLFGLGSIGSILIGISTLGQSLILSTVMLVIGIVYLICVSLLLFNSFIKSYMLKD